MSNLNLFPLVWKLDAKVWEHFTGKKSEESKSGDRAAFLWLQSDIESICLKGTDLSKVKEYINDLMREDKKYDIPGFSDFFHRNIEYEKIEKSLNVRKDFRKALRNVKKGSELSGILGYSFFKEDIRELAKFHKAGKYREKIEDLLEDCNFHSEYNDFIDGRYDKYLNS